MVIFSLASNKTQDPLNRIPAWTPCSADPVFFDCRECEIGWRPCRLRVDDSLRHWRAAQYSRRSGPLSANEERDNSIEKEVTQLLRSHGVSINVGLLFQYLSRRTLAGIEVTDLENLLLKSHKFLESSPRMFKLADLPQAEALKTTFQPLPVSTGTQLEAFFEASTTLGAATQIRLFREYVGLKLLASLETRHTAQAALDQIVHDCLEKVLSTRGWTIRAVHKYAVGSEPIPISETISREDVSMTNQLLSAVSAGELLTRMSPSEASEQVKEVRRLLLLGNVRLVAHEARARAHGGFLTFADLFQIGTIGLMTATERFDPYRGFQFSTYATHWIRQAIRREKANTERNIRVPVHVVEQINSLLKQREDLEEDLGRSPTAEELALEIDLEPERVELLLQMARPIESLEALIASDQEALEEQLQLKNDSVSQAGTGSSSEIMTEAIEEVLSTLTERESRVIRMRYGIRRGVPQTLEQIGQDFGVTRERIRQIQAKALRKLRHPSRSRKLKDFLE